MIGSHRDQAHFDRARWRKRVLLPCWIIQIPILLALMGVFSYRLTNTVKTFKDEQSQGRIPMVEFVWEIVNITFAAVSFILDLVQIAKFIAEALTPCGMLFGNTVSLTLSLAILALDVFVYVQHTEKQYSMIALALDCAFLFFTIIPIAYGIHVYRRIANYDEYAHPHNVKHYGFTEPQDTSYDPARMSLSHDPESQLYDPAGQPDGRPRRPSFRRSLSGISLDRRTPPVSPHPQSRPDTERRASYDHKRDPSFDEYIATIPKETLQAPRSRGNSLTRPASWEINMGDSLETPVGSIHCGHSLVAVPEAREEEDTSYPRGKSRPVSEDRQGLLNDPRASAQSVATQGSRSSRMEPIYGLEDIALESKKRRRDS